jgi:hypothetical protein
MMIVSVEEHHISPCKGKGTKGVMRTSRLKDCVRTSRLKDGEISSHVKDGVRLSTSHQ